MSLLPQALTLCHVLNKICNDEQKVKLQMEYDPQYLTEKLWLDIWLHTG